MTAPKNSRATAVRRLRSGSAPIAAAGPTRCGAPAGARATRTMYQPKNPISTAESNSVIECRSGKVSP